LATVYKNLHALKDNGIVVEVNMPNGKMRYDIYTKPHIHLVCKNCNSVYDMDYDEKLFDYQNTLESQSGYEIDRLDVIASVNRCKHCS
jgi:Fur family peroxide stress response transcriptional regulator